MMRIVFKTVFLGCFLLADASEYTAYPKLPWQWVHWQVMFFALFFPKLLYGYCSICHNGAKISKDFISKHVITLLNAYTNLSSSPTSIRMEQHFFCFIICKLIQLLIG